MTANTITNDNVAICQKIRGEKKARDDEICRLLAQDWTPRQVADHMQIGVMTIHNVTRARRQSSQPVLPASETAPSPPDEVTTVSFQDAPIAAWRQAVLPEIEKAVAIEAEPGTPMFRATVVLMLLHLKAITKRERRISWLRRITGYGTGELTQFLVRARDAGIMEKDGCIQPLQSTDECDQSIEIVIDAMVLAGYLKREDGKYSIAAVLAA